jgi:hypothetical protein
MANLQSCHPPAKGSGLKSLHENSRFGKPEGRTADPSTTLPRISCGTWWRWCTSCAFPLQKGAYAALSSAAWQEIRVRSGQDDNSSWKLYLAFPNKIVIPSEAEGSAVRPSGFPKFWS